MIYVSTRDANKKFSFSEAIREGLAPDGGLFVPETFPLFDQKFIDANFSPDLSLPDFAAKLLTPFLSGDRLQSQIASICKSAFTFPIPLRSRSDGSSVLELFHGPTAAFKDVGASFLAECVSRLQKPGETQTVIVATSGDTGGAVAGAFVGKPGFEIFILFPKGRISLRQEKQIACWGKNVKAFAVKGSFDDCQKIVKEALSDATWRREKNFVSANSISIGRLLPQMIYYAQASLESRRKNGQSVNFAVPTGNLGNAVAALWAKKIGFPIERVLLATNANHSIEDYFATGIWSPKPTIATLANAMDVGSPSNFERLRSLYPQVEDLKRDVAAVSVSDQEIEEEIRGCFKASGEIYCPHTATALRAVKKLGVQPQNWIYVSTAHAAKFETIVEPLIGQSVEIPGPLKALLNRESVYQEIEPTLASLKSLAG